MKVGVIGIGVVGSAISKGFAELGHEVYQHDIKLDTKIEDVLTTDVVYLCLPTNSTKDGECDISIILKVLRKLKQLNYEGIVAVKSTIIPGTYKQLIDVFDKDRICLVPEFLRELHAYEDFTKKHNVLVIGTEDLRVANLIIDCHGSYPKNVKIITPQECEFVKYFSNVFKAYKTVFANSFGLLCSLHDVNYANILDVYKAEGVGELDYLKYWGGFEGMCLPKDTLALANLAKETNIDTFDFILNENKKHL